MGLLIEIILDFEIGYKNGFIVGNDFVFIFEEEDE